MDLVALPEKGISQTRNWVVGYPPTGLLPFARLRAVSIRFLPSTLLVVHHPIKIGSVVARFGRVRATGEIAS